MKDLPKLNSMLSNQILTLHYFSNTEEHWEPVLTRICPSRHILYKYAGLLSSICGISVKIGNIPSQSDAKKLVYAVITSRLNYFYAVIIRMS